MKDKSEQENGDSLKRRLLNSSAIGSLNQELNIYNKFEKLGWSVSHSPYYSDSNTGKFREVDVSARKYWKIDNEDFSFGLNFIIECKSINNYQIVVCNEQKPEKGSYIENNWIGDDWSNHYSKTIKLLEKHNIKPQDIQDTVKLFHKHLFPDGLIRYIDYRLESFEIPVYCSFRETNIGTTKEMENSVVWKAFQSLFSYINSHKVDAWKDIDFDLYDIDNEELISTYEGRLEALKEALILHSNHIELIHPVLVVESKLWELKENNLEELKYCRLLFQDISGFDTWIDIVNYNSLDEYLTNSKKYDEFYTEKGFKND